MVKCEPLSLKKEEKDAILEEARLNNDFDYLLYSVLTTTGRRIGELYGKEEKRQIGVRKTGKKKKALYEGKEIEIERTIPIYKKLGKWKYGVKVKDIDFERGTMKVWVFKRGKDIQDESVLLPHILKLLNIYIKRNRLGLEDHVFRKEGRKYRNLNNILKKYAKEVKVPIEKTVGDARQSLSLHSFRHYFITELKRLGWRDEDIMIATGHKTAAVLKTYSHIVPYDIKNKLIESVGEI